MLANERAEEDTETGVIQGLPQWGASALSAGREGSAPEVPWNLV